MNCVSWPLKLTTRSTLWDLASGKERQLVLQDLIDSLTWWPDGKLLAVRSISDRRGA